MQDTIQNEMLSMPIQGGNFTFSAIRPDSPILEEVSYTLVTIAADRSTSVEEFSTLLDKLIETATQSCKLGSRAGNILLRLVTFSHTITEVFGFVPLDQIPALSPITCYGNTALVDAVYTSMGATLDYAKMLQDQDYQVNGIIFILTDGEENSSKYSMGALKNLFQDVSKKELLNKMISILIGINVADCKQSLENFQRESGISKFIDAGDATPKNIAKIAEFVSKSISSSSGSLQSGVPVDINNLNI